MFIDAVNGSDSILNTFVVYFKAAVWKKVFNIRYSERFWFIETNMYGFERNSIPCQRIFSVLERLKILRVGFSEVGLYLYGASRADLMGLYFMVY